MPNNNNLGYFDMIAILSLALQVSNYQHDIKAATTDDLMAELQKQDREYFKQIINNQNRILSILSRFDDLSAE